MRVWQVEGDFDLMWANCSSDSDLQLLIDAVYKRIRIDASTVIPMEWSRGKIRDRLLLDCGQTPGYGTLLLSDGAISALKHLLDLAGYTLDVKLDAASLYKIFICDNAIDVLDEDRSEFTRFPDGVVWEITKHEFYERDFSQIGIFYLKNRPQRPLVTDLFVDIVIEHGLSGFVFTEIWNSDTGGVQLVLPKLPLESFKGEFEQRANRKRSAFRKTMAQRQPR